MKNNTSSHHWSFLGLPHPSWSLALGWAAVYAYHGFLTPAG